MDPNTESTLMAEVNALRHRVAELEEVLHAIRTGQVDALVDGSDIYTLGSAESASNRFRGQVLRQISETVIALDNDQRITYINEAAERQYDRKATDVIGLPLSELHESRWLEPGDERSAWDAIRDHGHWRGENLHVKPNGEVIHVESVVNVLHDEALMPIGLLAVMRDISEHVKARQALAENAKQKDRFLATLAHELRNPLAPLTNGLELLDADDLDKEQRNATGAMMKRQLTHLVRLVDDLMDLSRISRGKIQLVKTDIDLRTVVATAVEASKPLFEHKGHQLRTAITSDRLVVHGDADRLIQVVTNLLNNAAKYTSAGGHIDLWAGVENDLAVIRVEDNGVGIDPAAMPKVFDMFAQVDPDHRTPAGGGLGIGLNVVQRLVRMHQGEVEGHSEGLGKGSQFIMRLPMAPDTAASATEAALPPKAGTTETRRVLVVDDNQDAAVSMSMILKKQGHVVETAYDGSEGVAKAEGFRPHVVIMDIGMPRMNGYDACKAMRAEEWGKDIHIIALSGWGQAEDRKRSHEAGFDEHVVKPIDRNTLILLMNAAPERMT